MEEKDSFTIGTPATGGSIKVYYDTDNAETKIQLALNLYQKYVEIRKLKSATQH